MFASTDFQVHGEVDSQPGEPPVLYLATILGHELYWRGADDCPEWPDGEPKSYTFAPDGGITVEPLVDVHRLPSYVRQGKVLDCGHRIPGGAHYLTLLASEHDLCLACGETQHDGED